MNTKVNLSKDGWFWFACAQMIHKDSMFYETVSAYGLTRQRALRNVEREIGRRRARHARRHEVEINA